MKIVLSILISVFILFVGCVATTFSILNGDIQFGIPLVIAITIGLVIFMNVFLFKKKKTKMLKWSFITFLTVAAVAFGVKDGYRNHLENIKIVSTQDVDLFQYMPFQTNTKTVHLNGESKFKMENPILKLDGSTALYPVYAGFVQAAYPEKTYDPYDSNVSEVVSSQTSDAFRRLINKEVDMIFAPKPNDEIIELAKKRGITLHMTPIGKEAFVFFVNQKNPVEELTVEEIQGIYSGEIKNWKEVGGKSENILAFQRPEESGSQGMLVRFMGDKKIMKPKTELVSGMGDIIHQTSDYRNHGNAIGYSFRFFSEEMVENGSIKNIAVNGILPSKETIKNGTYPITTEFYAITIDNNDPKIKSFIEWILSEQGQDIIEETGYVSIH